MNPFRFLLNKSTTNTPDEVAESQVQPDVLKRASVAKARKEAAQAEHQRVNPGVFGRRTLIDAPVRTIGKAEKFQKPPRY